MGTSLAKATTGDLFDALTSWVLASVQWLLGAVGAVLASTTEPATVVRSASPEFEALLVVAPELMLAGLVVATISALRHGDASSLWRVYLGVAPACVLALVVARPLSGLTLTAVNQLCGSATTSVTLDGVTLARAVTALATSTAIPGFALFLLSGAVVIGGWLLWCELIVRSVVLSLLLALTPLVVPLATFPALRRAGWRLAETFLAVAASKLVIVVALSLGLDELSGPSATEVITGAVTLMLATASPFLLLRMIPLMEQSALHHLEGLRQRATRVAQSAPASPVGRVASALRPDAPISGPPERPEDLGLGMWEGRGEVDLPPFDGDPPPPPVGEPRLRGGHVAYHLDESGPVVGWHFDE